MVRFTVDNRNRLIFYGNPVGYVKADTAVVDEMFRTDELNQYLSRMNLTPRWEDGIFDRLVSGEVTGEELAQSRKGCRIWQLKKDVDVAMRFIGYVACCGTSIQPVLQMLEQVPQLDTVLLCLDNDEAGHQASRRMREQLETHYSVESLIPENKDWNDDLTLSAENAQGFSMNEMR